MTDKITDAHILNGWVVCPFCFSKQFPLEGTEEIKNLKYRCRKSTGTSEHFMIINSKEQRKNAK